MKTLKYFLSIISLLLFLSNTAFSQTTLEQFLDVVRNDEVAGGEFHVAIKVKGTNLTTANTLGSLTIDVIYNNVEVTFLGAAPGVISPADGYNIVLSDNGPAVRFGFTGGGVGPGLFEKDGYDVSASFETYITLHFIIVNPNLNATLTISEITNQIGLFDSHANNNSTGVIHNQVLSPPINVDNVPLPVELTSFTAKYNSGSVMLAWETASEKNSYGFEVERLDVKAEPNHWVNLGFVQGAGNSNVSTKYNFIDDNLSAENYRYRLKQIDNDGSYKYLSDVEVIFDLIVDEYTLTQNYPNPFNPSTKIKFGFKVDTETSLKVFNTLGQEVKTLFNSNAEAGKIYDVIFDAATLPSGVYLYELKGGNVHQIRKMILLK